MRDWDARHLAAAAARRDAAARALATSAATPGPTGVSIDSRGIAPGDLFVGLRGERSDGGAHAGQALEAGAWGVLVGAEHAEAARRATCRHGGRGARPRRPAARRCSRSPARGGESCVPAGAMVVAITGSTGKTSTKDILAALLSARLRVAASPENLNTEIGLPLAILAAPRGHGAAGAGDGDARAGPDRGADGDRRAGRGRDRRTSARRTWSCWERSRRSRRPRPS